jgi:hypothetical protein
MTRAERIALRLIACSAYVSAVFAVTRMWLG